jgi:hypothetical protein
MVRALSFALVLASAFACTTAAPVAAPTHEALRARDYYPLAAGNTWSYLLTPGGSLEEVRVLDRDQAGFYVDTKGVKLAPRTDGIFDGQRFLIAEPIEVGNTWMAVPDPKSVEHFTIKAVGVQAVVPAGAFADCIQVENVQATARPKPGKVAATWTYAPHVGLVKFTLVFKPDDGDEPAEVARMELAKYQVKATE